MKRITQLILVLSLLAACYNGRQQRLQLEELERQNRADSLMLNDSLARDLTDYFDRHGTRNEQLRAFYILGRTYADRGEAPAALEAYHDAIDRADTTAADCDYYTLCRVYSQMAVLFNYHNLLADNLCSLDRSIHYAYLAGDTITAMNSYGQKAVTYDMLKKPDSVFSSLSMITSHPELSNCYMAIACNAYIMKGDLENARRCMDIYEQGSGYFDSQGNIEKGREAYYNIKGRYYLAIGQLDSSEHYYRRELYEGRGFLFQNMSARSLSQLYHCKGNADSTAKYSLYSYEMNDSTYKQMSTKAVAHVQAMYDYSRHQHMAEQEKERANREHQHFLSLVFFVIGGLIVISVFVGFIVYVLQYKRKLALQKYYKKVDELNSAQQELYELRQRESEANHFVQEKEQEIIRLQSELENSMQNAQLMHDNLKFKMEEAGIAQLLRRKAASGSKLSKDEWERIVMFVDENLPNFYMFLSSKSEILGLQKTRICILLRLFVGVKNTGTMLGVSGAYISKTSKQIVSELFLTEGGGKELTRKLSEI